MHVRVEGGTKAGVKRPLKAAATWSCSCPPEFGDAPAADALFAHLEHPSWRTRCERCGTCKP